MGVTITDVMDFWTDLREPSECYPRGVVLPCADLPPWGDDPDETCPFCNAKRNEPCLLENELTPTE